MTYPSRSWPPFHKEGGIRVTGKRYALLRFLIIAGSLALAILTGIWSKKFDIAAIGFFAAYIGASYYFGRDEKDLIQKLIYIGAVICGVFLLFQIIFGVLLPEGYRIEYSDGAKFILSVVLLFAAENIWNWKRLSKGTRKYLKKKYVWFGITLVAAILLNFFLPRFMRGAGDKWREDPLVVNTANEQNVYLDSEGITKVEGREYLDKNAWGEYYDDLAKELGVYKDRSDVSITALVSKSIKDTRTDENKIKWRDRYDAVEKDLGRDGGMLGELWHFVQHMFDGTFGKSTSTSRYPKTVSSIISEGIVWTLVLQIPAILVGWILGNLLGAIAAYRRKFWDKAVMPTSLFISAIPAFGSAVILMVIFALNLKWFPPNKAYDPGMIPAFSWKFISNVLYHYQLPFWSIVLISIGGQAVGMRSMSIYELNADYVKYSRFLGIKDKRIVRYVFRNAMLPQVTGLAMSIGTSIGGALVAETIFSYPGLGMKMYDAITSNDYNTISGIALIITIMVLIAAFLLDLIYAVIDPRVKAAQFD